MNSPYLVNASLRIESKTRSVAELVDAFGESDLTYGIGDHRSKKIIKLGLHEKNGLVFNSRLEATRDADAHVADLVRIAQRVPREVSGVDRKILLFIQTTGLHHLQIADVTLKLLADNKLNLEISFD